MTSQCDTWRWTAATLLLGMAFVGKSPGAPSDDPLEIGTDPSETVPAVEPLPELSIQQIAAQVEIVRDEWGVAHVLGKTDEATLFGAGYAQAEDYFWQVEDNVIRAVGRYAEAWGRQGLQSDILNRQFEIVARSEADFARIPAQARRLLRAFTEGLNYYRQTHPECRPRLIQRFEPWHVLCVDRHFLLDFAYGRSHISRSPAPPLERAAVLQRQFEFERSKTIASWEWPAMPDVAWVQEAHAAIGSNEWAVAGSKTQSGKTMLLINPHQPWFGWGQYYEIHLHSQETLRFTGAGFYGIPIPSKGHNGRLGWTYTVNDPDIADAWRETFDDPNAPLNYRYGEGYRRANEWTETIGVRELNAIQPLTFTFRKTHHGPIVRQEQDGTYLAVQVSALFDIHRGDQAIRMIQAQDWQTWRQAVQRCAIPMFNIAYADQAGNIFYAYNGAIPRRDPSFDWRRPVDGSDPRTEWQGIHAFSELPQVFNPPSGYVQNCNSSPFTTTDVGNPFRDDFPSYMFDDADLDKRRAQISRKLLRESHGLTFDQWQALAYDTTLYWPLIALPQYARVFETMRATDPELARQLEPYLTHLLEWNCRSEPGSTATTLCIAWYEELYGFGYPAETLLPKYRGKPTAQLAALVSAAKKLEAFHGTWRVPWDQVHRIKRVVKVPSVEAAGIFVHRWGQNVPCLGAPGPLGVVYTVYSTPSIPQLRPQRFSLVGTSYLAVVEFTDRVRAASAVPFGSSSDPMSDHYFDQAKLFSERKLKPAWFYEEDVRSHAERSYLLSEVDGVESPRTSKPTPRTNSVR